MVGSSGSRIDRRPDEVVGRHSENNSFPPCPAWWRRSECKCTVCFSERRSSSMFHEAIQFHDLLEGQIQRGDQIQLDHLPFTEHPSGESDVTRIASVAGKVGWARRSQPAGLPSDPLIGLLREFASQQRAGRGHPSGGPTKGCFLVGIPDHRKTLRNSGHPPSPNPSGKPVEMLSARACSLNSLCFSPYI